MGSTQSGGLSENPLNWPCIAEAFRTAPSATPHRLSLSLSFSLSVSHHPLVPSRLSSPARLSPAQVSSLPTAEALGPSPGAAPVPWADDCHWRHRHGRERPSSAVGRGGRAGAFGPVSVSVWVAEWGGIQAAAEADEGPAGVRILVCKHPTDTSQSLADSS